jgi:hypothetical protein
LRDAGRADKLTATGNVAHVDDVPMRRPVKDAGSAIGHRDAVGVASPSKRRGRRGRQRLRALAIPEIQSEVRKKGQASLALKRPP